MKNGLLVIERMVLESLSKKNRNLEELANDTGLDHGLLKNILPAFLMNNLVNYQRGIYKLNNDEMRKERIKSYNAKENIKEEVKELFTSMVNKYFREDLQNRKNKIGVKVKKVWLTPQEEKIFNSYLINLESFIQSIEQQRKLKPQKEKLCEKKVVIWGYSDYSSIADGSLCAV